MKFAPILLVLFGIILLGGMFAVTTLSEPASSTPSSTINFNSRLCIGVVREDGTVEDGPGCQKNLLFDTGKNLTRQYLFDVGGGTDEIDQIHLCNASTGGGDCGTVTAAGAEGWLEYAAGGLTAATATYTNLSEAGNCSLYNEFTATENNMIVNATRLSNTAGQNFSGANFTAVTLNSGDKLTINWTIWVT